MGNKYFTSDTHFSSYKVIEREFRPFNTSEELNREVVNQWCTVLNKDDTIYHLGDFITYNYKDTKSWEEGLSVVKNIPCKVILIIGNNEERLIARVFRGSFNKFKEYCLSLGFEDVVYNLEIEMRGVKFYLNHYPRKHKDGYVNLFGHVHLASGIYKPFGLNVGCDLYHFRLLTEDMLFEILRRKSTYWLTAIDINCI